MIKTKQKWEDFPDLLANMPYVCEAIGLDKVPHFTTLNKFFLRMKNKVILILILMSAGRFSGLASVDATGYDSRQIRKPLRQEGIRVLIPYREFKPKQKYWNSLIDRKDYHQRSKSECVNSVIKRKYKDFLSSHEWNNQHKEAALLCLVYNVDRDVKKGLAFLIGFLRS